MTNILGILEEDDEGQDQRFYIYDFTEENPLEWFDTLDDALERLHQMRGDI